MALRPRTAWVIRIMVSLMVIALVAGGGFILGVGFAGRRAYVDQANDGCINSIWALTLHHEPDSSNTLELLFDYSMDDSALRLARGSLEAPNLIDRGNYNVLRRFQEYREKHGRLDRSTQVHDPSEVDGAVAEAIAYLETLHDTNVWGTWKVGFDDEGNFKPTLME